MNRYEGIFIFKPDLNKDELNRIVGQVQEVIVKNKGSVEKVNEMGRQRLAYPIKKFREGVYYLINFIIPSGQITEIRRNYRLNDGILRVSIIKT